MNLLSKLANAQAQSPIYMSIRITKEFPIFQSRAYVTAPSIVHLFLYCSPTAIIRRIWTIVIDPIQRVHRFLSAHTLWPSAHVRQEIGETITPAFTNGNTPASIMAVLHRCRIQATDSYVVPRAIFRRMVVRPSNHLAMCSKKTFCLLTNNLTVQTAATSSPSFLQSVSAYRFMFAARTQAAPMSMFFVKTSCPFEDSEPSKFMPAQVSKRWSRHRVSFSNSDSGSAGISLADGGLLEPIYGHISHSLRLAAS